MRKIPALRALTDLMGRAPPVAAWSARHASCITTRWRHPALQGGIPALSDTVVAVWFGGEGAIEHRHGHSTLLGHAGAGAVCIVPVGEESWIATSVPFDGVHVILSAEHLRAVAREVSSGDGPRLRACVAEQDPLIFSLAELVTNVTGARDPSSQFIVEHVLDLICVRLLSGHSYGAPMGTVRDRQRRTALDAPRLASIDAYIDERLDQALTIDELAGIAGLSRSHFCTAFRHARGVTPHEHLTDRRIQRAKELLEESPSTSIGSIATRVGFRTTSSFCAIFKRSTGSTPTMFRQLGGRLS